ncbi:pimeloyl-ACP methyl ester carboxylesterase [Thermocatellispora tengchongensis]|uniref:Pimeloyl-ACP methyl ester carboxylesterase n=1 Tax=Thermocatellispora tengchongensis TaxID=1073253 RepID=A0A840P3X3_9ACTN|nr:alpha/beta hydrolase [Thermocatellispora tengchongensis]MBB5132603.1 pimeloyl-ACP methyl ester carboxylesterase [Thermocatellispora tengchongensis]
MTSPSATGPSAITSTVAHATSRDGTPIGYRVLGRGPGLVALHGAMQSSYSHVQLAEELAGDFTVYLPDRRGRGLSGPWREDHGMRTEVEDLAAVLAATGARDVLGVSSGALITLRAALTLPGAIRRAAIFEPPLFTDGPAPTDWLRRHDREMAAGKVAAALVSGMLGAQMGPPALAYVPRPVLVLLTRLMMRRTGGGEAPSFQELAPTLHYDGELVVEMARTQEAYRAIEADVLLLKGSRSPQYLRDAVDALARVLPRARLVELPGLHHGATGNRDQGGRPHVVARELRRFLTGA